MPTNKDSFAGHKLVADNHNHYVIKHPDGSTFQVAKAGLTAKMHAHIAKMPKVEHDDDGTQDAPFVGGSPQPADNNAAPDTPPPSEDVPNTQNAVDGTTNSVGVMQSDQNPDLSGVVSDPQLPTTQPQPSGMPDLGGQYLSDMQGALGAQKAANTAKAAAEGAESDDIAAAYQDNLAKTQIADDSYNARNTELQTRGANLEQQVANGQIDPNRLWSNASNGSRIAALAGILVSGLGSGLTGQPNMAMQVINKAVEHDIDAQKSNLATKQNLLSYNLQQQRDLNAAHAQTRLDLLSTLKGQISQAAAKQGSAIAQANAQGLNAQIDTQMAGLRHEMAVQHAMMTMAGQGSAQGTASDPNDIDMGRLRTSVYLGSQGYPNGIPKELVPQAMKEQGTFGRLKDSLNTVNKQFDTMDQTAPLIDSGGPLKLDATRKWDAAATNVWMNVLKDAEGRVTPAEIEEYKNNGLIQWGDSPEVKAQKRQDAQDLLRKGFSKDADGFGTLKTYGIIAPDNPYINSSATTQKQGRDIK